MAWNRLTLRLPVSDLAEIEALVTLAGARSITVSDQGDEPIFEPAPGTTPLWSLITLSAMFDEESDIGALSRLLARANREAPIVERIDEADLATAGMQDIQPAEFGTRLAIMPADRFVPGDTRQVGLHMGLAFGTGQHPTTRLCLEWIGGSKLAGKTVLDYGCGSGVLAIAALRIGAAGATAIDNEPQALEATRRNAELNGCAEQLLVGLPDRLPDSCFDLILANILAGPLIDLADSFARRQPKDAVIVLSGMLSSQLDEVQDRYSRWYRSFERRALDDWGLLTGRRRSGYDF